MPSPVAIDFETFYSKKLKYSVKTMIAEQYCRHSLFDPYIISVCDGTTCWAGHPRDFNWAALDGRIVLAHNWYFDYNVWLEMARRGLAPKPNFAAAFCTANMTSYLCNRRALDAAVQHLMGVSLSKVAREDANNKKWETFSEPERIDMLQYARRDTFYCWGLFDKFAHRWPEFERRLSRMTIEQGMHGVQINRDLLDEYILRAHDMRTKTEQAIPWIRDSDDDEEGWEDFKTKPTSTKCIAEQCRRNGIPCCPVKSEDEEAYADWEMMYAPTHPWIIAVSAWRSINKLYKTLMTVKERLRGDGTLPFGLKYFGAHTGRWSGDSKVNMQNMRKVPAIANEHGMLEMNDLRIEEAMKYRKAVGLFPDWVKGSIDFRALVTPRPGKKMIASDLSQIEPRVLAWCAKDWKFLERVAAGVSCYQAHAEATMGWPVGQKMDKDGADSEVYKLAKARVLALGYGAGWEKFILMAQTLAGFDITRDDPEFIEETNPFTGVKKQVSGYGTNSKRIVGEYRTQNSKVKGIWERLDDGFKRSVGSDFILQLPSGRKMRYERVRCECRFEQDKDTKRPVRRTVFTADSDGRRRIFYGGKLCENLIQATSRDVFAEHLLRLEDRGWWNLFSVHDEAVLEVDLDVSVKDVEHEMSHCPDWLEGCPIAAEAKELAHYKK